MYHDDKAQSNDIQLHGPRILLLDHRSRFIRVLYEALIHQGYNLRLAFNTPELLNGSQRWKPDLIGIVSGIPFPGLPDVCRRLHIASGVPLLVLSTPVPEKVLVECLEAGANDFVTIPGSVAEIAARIRSQLRRSCPHPAANQHAA